MSEEKIDITKQAEDLANEKLAKLNQEKELSKVSDLEAKLAEYQKKEQEALALEEEKKKSEISKRLEELEKAREEDKKSYEDKLEKLSTRQSSGKVKTDPKEALTREEYEANKSQYNQILAKHILENKTL